MMYYVYILECADGTLYTGITTDVERRLREHQEGKGGNYTRAKGARNILYIEQHLNRSSATIREAAIKKLSKKEKLKLSMES